MTRGKLMQRLHAVAAKRGFGHDALREQCGVQSLAELSEAQLLTHIQRLEGRPYRPRLVRSPHAPATDRQRRKIHALFAKLDWTLPKTQGWMGGRYGIGSLWHDDPKFTVAIASDMIAALEQAISKGPGGRIAKEGAAP